MNKDYIEIKSDRDARVVRTTTFLLWAIVLIIALIVWAILTIVNQVFPVGGSLPIAVSVLSGVIFAILILRIL